MSTGAATEPSAPAPAEQPAPAVRATDLTKVYDERTVVDGLSLSVAPGEVFGLLGPNGAGKTTTILMLLGLTERTAGEVEVMGTDPAVDPIAVKRRVGYLPDDVGFYENMTGRQNLRYTARLNGLRGDHAEERVTALLDQVGLPEAGDQLAGTYSRGMRQRLGIADALVADPDVLILDEPTIAIDPRGVEQMLGLITGLASDRGVAVLLSSHLLDQVEAICDRVAIFVAGKVQATGTREELAAAEGGGVLEVALELPGPDDAERAAEVVGRLEGVTGVTVEGLTARVLADRDVRADLPPALVAADVPLLGMAARRASLAEIYRSHFRDPDPAAANDEGVAA